MTKSSYKIFIAALAICALHSCGVGVKSSSGPGGGGLVSFYNKGKDSLLCFAGPVEFKAINHSGEFFIDYTYLKVKNQSNPVICNFSVITEDAKFKPAELTIAFGEESYRTDKIDKIFAEGFGKKDYKYRYTFSMSDSLFYRWMQEEKSTFKVNELEFEGGKAYRKASEEIFRSVLFDLYQ